MFISFLLPNNMHTKYNSNSNNNNDDNNNNDENKNATQ